MPLSFQRSFKKKPGNQVNTGGRSTAKPKAAKGLSSSQLGAPRLFLGLPLGCGFAIGLCGLALVTGTVIQNLPALAPPGLAGTVRVVATSATSAVSDPGSSSAPTSTPGTTPTVPAGSPPATHAPQSLPNPWASEIPQAACIPTDLPQTGRVVEVIDAQTIRVLMDRDQRVYAVRYIGIEIPQSSDQLLTLNGILRNMELTYGKRATLVRDLTDRDDFGRLLRYVMVGSTFINYDLIAGGYARVKPSPPDTACYSAFKSVQQQAESNGLGIWSVATPTP